MYQVSAPEFTIATHILCRIVVCVSLVQLPSWIQPIRRPSVECTNAFVCLVPVQPALRLPDTSLDSAALMQTTYSVRAPPRKWLRPTHKADLYTHTQHYTNNTYKCVDDIHCTCIYMYIAHTLYMYIYMTCCIYTG